MLSKSVQPFIAMVKTATELALVTSYLATKRLKQQTTFTNDVMTQMMYESILVGNNGLTLSSSSSRACISCLHRPLSWASCHAEFRPWLSGWRSASRVRSQVWRGHPGRRLQSLGRPRIDVCNALDRSRELPVHAVLPHAQLYHAA